MKNRFLIIFFAIVCILSISVCAQAQTDSNNAVKTDSKILICEASDMSGIKDNSFNQTAWEGIQQAEKQYGVKGTFLESKTQDDYGPNINRFVADGCTMILTVGSFYADSTKYAASIYPNTKFSIIDTIIDLPNVVSQVFQTSEASFLAGYLAAGMSKTGAVGTYGGMCIPAVEAFMDGFANGVDYYNQQKGTSIKVLGWDREKQTGTCIDSFSDKTKAQDATKNLMDQKADVILAAAGGASSGSLTEISSRGTGLFIGVDADMALEFPDDEQYILTSVLKKTDATTLSVISQIADGTFAGGKIIGNLENGGVGLAPFHSLDDQVSDEMKSDLAQIKADIISGKIKMNDAYVQK